MKRKAEFWGRGLKPDEIRTIFSVVVSDNREWTEDEIDASLWDGNHGPRSTVIDFHVTRECTWGPIESS